MAEKTSRVFHAGPSGKTTIEPKPVAPEATDDAGLGERALREMSFSTHVISLNATALFHMGLLAEEGAPEAPDLEAARHVIDTLGMLRVKTLGNLTDEEEKLLSTILYDLRMRFVQLTR